MQKIIQSLSLVCLNLYKIIMKIIIVLLISILLLSCSNDEEKNYPEYPDEIVIIPDSTYFEKYPNYQYYLEIWYTKHRIELQKIEIDEVALFEINEAERMLRMLNFIWMLPKDTPYTFDHANGIYVLRPPYPPKN